MHERGQRLALVLEAVELHAARALQRRERAPLVDDEVPGAGRRRERGEEREYDGSAHDGLLFVREDEAGAAKVCGPTGTRTGELHRTTVSATIVLVALKRGRRGVVRSRSLLLGLVLILTLGAARAAEPAVPRPPMPRLPFDAEQAKTLQAEWARAFGLEGVSDDELVEELRRRMSHATKT